MVFRKMIYVKILFYACLIVGAFCWLLVYTNAHPPRHPLFIPPSNYGLEFEAVAFDSKEGIKLDAWFIPSPSAKGTSPAIVLCHGLGASKSDFTELGVSLARKGFHALLFDFRAHGKSGGRKSSFGWREKEDLLAAINYLTGRKEVDPDRIGVYGFSMGGATALMTAVENGEIKAVVADSSFASLREQTITILETAYGRPFKPLVYPLMWIYEIYFGSDPEKVSPLDAMSGIFPGAVMIIGGGEDEQMPTSVAKRLFNAAREPKELWLIPGAVHGGTLYTAGEEYSERVGGFFSKHLGPKHQ